MKTLFLTLLVSCFSGLGLSSDTRYKTFSESSVRRCSIMHARKPSFNICLSGKASTPDLERSQSWAARATLTWLRALKLLDDSVTRNITFTCNSSHLTINLKPGKGTSFASPGVTTIYLTRPYGTWTHELGHAFAGLSDTYVGGSAGSCGNQPQSLMCWGAYGPRANPEEWSTLWSDDIQGIQYNYLRVFNGNLVEPNWGESINLEEPLDLNSPWPASRFDLNSEDIHFKDHRVNVVDGPASEIDFSRDSRSIDL